MNDHGYWLQPREGLRLVWRRRNHIAVSNYSQHILDWINYIRTKPKIYPQNLWIKRCLIHQFHLHFNPTRSIFQSDDLQRLASVQFNPITQFNPMTEIGCTFQIIKNLMYRHAPICKITSLESMAKLKPKPIMCDISGCDKFYYRQPKPRSGQEMATFHVPLGSAIQCLPSLSVSIRHGHWSFSKFFQWCRKCRQRSGCHSESW